MIIEQQPNPRLGRVDLVQFRKQGNEIALAWRSVTISVTRPV